MMKKMIPLEVTERSPFRGQMVLGVVEDVVREITRQEAREEGRDRERCETWCGGMGPKPPCRGSRELAQGAGKIESG